MRGEKALARHDEAVSEKNTRAARRAEIARFMDGIAERNGILSAFDEILWGKSIRDKREISADCLI